MSCGSWDAGREHSKVKRLPGRHVGNWQIPDSYIFYVHANPPQLQVGDITLNISAAALFPLWNQCISLYRLACGSAFTTSVNKGDNAPPCSTTIWTLSSVYYDTVNTFQYNELFIFTYHKLVVIPCQPVILTSTGKRSLTFSQSASQSDRLIGTSLKL